MRNAFNQIVALAGAIGIAASVAAGPAAAQDVVRVGVSPTAPAGGDPGFIADLMRAVGQQAGFTVVVTPMPLGEVAAAVVAGTIDVGQGTDNAANRALGLDFTGPVAPTSGMFVVRADNTAAAYTGFADVQGLAVGVTANTQWNNQLTAAGLTNIRTYPSFAAAMTALETGEIVTYYTNPTVFNYQHDIQNMHGWARIVPTFENTAFSPTALAVRAADTQLLGRINAGLEAIRANGTMATVAAAWAYPLMP